MIFYPANAPMLDLAPLARYRGSLRQITAIQETSNMLEPTRREFLRTTGAVVAAGMGMAHLGDHARAFVPSTPEIPAGDRPPQDKSVTMLHPRGRVPVSFIIDDSTCLVNMGAFCMPQFRAAWPQNPIYWKPWKNWPREIPNDFVREFGQFAAEQGVRGKYSLVPYPACVGWLDREMPGWSKKDLAESCLLYTSPSPRDRQKSRMPSSA